MLETKTTLKRVGETVCKEDCNICMFTWLKAKIQIQFYNKYIYIYILPQPHYTNPLFALIYFANHTLSIISINTIAKSSVYWNKLDVKLDVKPNIRLSRGSTNTFLAFWKDDWPLAFETWTFFFIKNMHKLWMVFMYIANLKRKKKVWTI